MEKSRLNSEMIWKMWKKGKLNIEKIWKIWKKGKLNTEKICKLWKTIVRRQGNYGRNSS